jgi:hypothetical protein
MRRRHALVLSLALGLAVAAGTFAATRTATLGARASDAQLSERAARLDRFEASLRRAAADRPPALPPAGAAAAPSAAGQPRVVYARPAPVPVLAEDGHGDDDHGEHEWDDGAGEHDDD